MTRFVQLFQALKLVSSYTRVRYFVAVIGVVSLFLNYKYNVNAHLGLQTINNFLDFVVSFADLYVVLIYIIFILIKYRYVQLFTILSVIPVLIGYLLYNEPVSLWQWITSISRISIFGWITYELFCDRLFTLSSKVIGVLGLFSLSLFDYYLVTDSLIPTILASAYIFATTPISNFRVLNTMMRWSIPIWYGVNAFVSSYQLITMRNLGLKYLGEVYLKIDQIGVAKQIIPFFGNIILRPYGLTNHPNILGGVSLLGLFLATQKPFRQMWKGRLIVFVSSITTLILSMSRNAFLAFGIVLIGYFVMTIGYEKKLKLATNHIFQLASSLGILILIGVVSLTRLQTSDTYRIEDGVRFFDTLVNLSWWHYIFGIGIGQYPFVLNHLYSLEAWQYQPVHSIPLYFIISCGPLLITILAWFLLTHFRQKIAFEKSLPLELYIQWYNSDVSKRNIELLITLKNNAKSGLFNQINIYYEQGTDVSVISTLTPLDTEINMIMKTKRVSYSDFYSDGLNKPKHIMVIANSDIEFDSSIRKLHEFRSNSQLFIAITRYENKKQIMPDGRVDYSGCFYSHSQDAWITNSQTSLSGADYQLGTPGCDQRLALHAAILGYSVINPYDRITTSHNHSSHVRSYIRSSADYSGWRLFPSTHMDRYCIIKE